MELHRYRDLAASSSAGMGVSAFSDLVGVSASTLRAQDESGEFLARRSPGGHRSYSFMDAERYLDARMGQKLQLAVGAMGGNVGEGEFLSSIRRVALSVYEPVDLSDNPILWGLLDTGELSRAYRKVLHAGHLTWQQGCCLFAASRGMLVETLGPGKGMRHGQFQKWLSGYGCLFQDGMALVPEWHFRGWSGGACLSGILEPLADEVRGFLYDAGVPFAGVGDTDLCSAVLCHGLLVPFSGESHLGEAFLSWVSQMGEGLGLAGNVLVIREDALAYLWEAYVLYHGLKYGDVMCRVPDAFGAADYLVALPDACVTVEGTPPAGAAGFIDAEAFLKSQGMDGTGAKQREKVGCRGVFQQF